MRTFADLETELIEATTTASKTELDRLLEKPHNPYTPRNHYEAWKQAEIIAASGLYGFAGDANVAYVVLMTGVDLGLTQSQACRGIKCIKGQPAPMAQTLVAICLNHPRVCEYFEPVEQTEKVATWVAKRRGRPERRYTFSAEDAKAAGLLPGKADSGWAKWPARMLSARAMAFLARDIFPDLTLGLYAAEEMETEPVETPKALESVAKWQAAAKPVEEPVAPPKPEPTPPPPAESTLLDPIEEAPVPSSEPISWQEAMRSASSKDEAKRIGKAAIAEDPSRRPEASEILNGFSK